EPPGGAPGEVAAFERRGELGRAQEELACAAERLARKGALACMCQRRRSLFVQVRRRGAVELGEQASGLVEVERADLDELVPRALLQPAGERAMQLGTGDLRQAGVRNLTD